MKFFIITLGLALLLAVAGCSSESSQDSEEQAVSQDTPAEESSGKPSTSDVMEENSPEEELKMLEVTPSGDEKCFLSPCDCNCYPIKNVPLTARKPTCATNCEETYGISGCRFTNYQCYALD